jgi:hypothetical protein
MVRESWKVLPGWAQRPLTTLSGKPYLGQPAWSVTPGRHLACAALALAAGLVLAAVAPLLGGAWWAALPLGWLLTVHAARKLQVLILHQASHFTFVPGKPWLNRLVGEAISIGLQIQAFESYRREHLGDHHSRNHMSVRDPTVAFLLRELGLRPGLPRAQAWRRLALRLLSPWFHLRRTALRLWSNLGPEAAPWHRLVSAAYVAAVAGLVTWFDAWPAFLTAAVLPLTVFYNAASALRLCVEHRFPTPRRPDRYTRDALASFTSAIFLGDPAPDPGLPWFRRLVAWAGWFLRLLFVHLPGRLLIVPGDTPCHDLHHRKPTLTTWPDYLFTRQRDVEDPRAHGWPPYTETWGSVLDSIDEVFLSLEKADPAEYTLPHAAT